MKAKKVWNMASLGKYLFLMKDGSLLLTDREEPIYSSNEIITVRGVIRI